MWNGKRRRRERNVDDVGLQSTDVGDMRSYDKVKICTEITAGKLV